MSSSSTPFYLRGNFIFGLLAAANLLNYIDRGIIPGSTNEINSFIKSDLHTSTPDVFLGLLQSSFIIGFMGGSIVFSHLIHSYGRFTLTGVGCTIWIVAVMLSGSAYYANSYVFLLFARILSGIAEASMQCAVPPWIQKTAPPRQKGLWLGIFYCAIPVGTAIGYAYSSICSESIGWQFAFFIEGFVMIPFVLYMILITPHFPPDKLADEEDEQQHPTVWQEILIVCGRPVFLCFCMAYAAQSATLMGLSTFGSAFMMGLGFSDSESDASTLFGIVVSVSGMISTPLGGMVLDRLLADHTPLSLSNGGGGEGNGTNRSADEIFFGEIDENQLAPLVTEDLQDHQPSRDHIYSGRVNRHLSTISTYIIAFTAVGGLLLSLIFVTYNKGLFLFLVAMGCGLIFMTNSAIMMGVMLSVPASVTSFGIAVNNVCLHGLGDVPAPVIVGYLKDVLAPGCIVKEDDDSNIAASEDCRDDGLGLRITMLATTLWLVWVIFFYGLAWIFCQRRFHLFSWGLIDFFPPSSSERGGGGGSGLSSSNTDNKRSSSSQKRNTSSDPSSSVVKEGANHTVWQGKTVKGPEDSSSSFSDPLDNPNLILALATAQATSSSNETKRGSGTKKRRGEGKGKTSQVKPFDDSYLPSETDGLMASVFTRDQPNNPSYNPTTGRGRRDSEKENDTRRTNSTEEDDHHDQGRSHSTGSKGGKSRVLSGEDLTVTSSHDKLKNIERIKRLSKDATSPSVSLGSATESSFQRVSSSSSNKKGLLQKDSFVQRLREVEDTIAI